MPIVVYAPALALNQVTGLDTYAAVSIIFVVCIFYTSIVSFIFTISFDQKKHAKCNLSRRNKRGCILVSSKIQFRFLA